jgi:hypothetical protein
MFITLRISAQNTFQALFLCPGNEFSSSMIEDFRGNFICVGGIKTESTLADYRGKIWRMSSVGDTLSKTFDFGDTTVTFVNIQQLDNKNYMITGKASLPPEFYDILLLLRLDSLFNIIERRFITLPGMQKMRSFVMKKNLSSYYLCIGNNGVLSNPPNQGDPYFVKLNSNFDTVLTSSYSIYGDQQFDDIIFSPDNGQIWVFGMSFIRDDFYSQSQMVIYDTAFQYISYTEFQEQVNILGNLNAGLLTDSTFLFSNVYQKIDGSSVDMSFSELDTTLLTRPVTIIGAQDTTDYTGARNSFDFFTNDSIFYAGTKNIIIGVWPQEVSWIRIGLLNRMLESQYEHFYGGDAFYWTSYIMATRDGGAFIAAQRYDYLLHNNYNDIFFLKVNNEGLVTRIEPTKDSRVPIGIYPNPGGDYIEIKIPEQITSVRIIDVYGKVVKSVGQLNETSKIDCSFLNPGLYFFRFMDKNGIYTVKKWVKQ